MRAGRHYACPSCGDTSPVGVRCDRCGVDMRDEHGRPAPPVTLEDALQKPPLWLVLWGLVGFGVGIDVLVLLFCDHYLSPGGYGIAFVLIFLLTMLPLLLWRRARRWKRAWVRWALARKPGLRGRVRVIEPVVGPDGTEVAAFSDGGAVHAGRFEILDDHGAAAVIDDDWIDLRGTSVLRAGDRVHVAQAPTPPRAAAGYRRAATVSLEGSPDRPLVILRE